MTQLTDLAIRRAKPARKPYTLKDGAGLYLNVRDNGTKHWLFRFYWRGKQKRMSFGVYPSIDLRKVCSLRQQAHDLLANGIDPRWRRRSCDRHVVPAEPAKNAITFAEYAERWKAFKLKKLGKEIPPYLVPLSRQAVRIVEDLLADRFYSQPYLLCHRYGPTQIISENTLNCGLRRMGYKDRLTGPGIRATISTALNELGYPKEWIEAQLSHSDKDQIRAAYNHAEYVQQRRQMMQGWADRLDAWEEEAMKAI